MQINCIRRQNDKGKGEPETKKKQENEGEIGLQKHFKRYKIFHLELNYHSFPTSHMSEKKEYMQL